MAADEPPKARRRRPRSKLDAPAAQPAVSIDAALDHERIQLMQIHAMLKCLYEVLLYADDDDSIMHADVANVAARLLNESVARLELLRVHSPRVDTPENKRGESQPAEGVVPPHHQVKDVPPPYLC